MSSNTGKQALFYSDIQAINKNAHQHSGLKDIEARFGYAATTHVAPIVFRELAAVAVSYPIIFVGEDRSPAAALGLNEGENLFVDGRGAWADDCYIPTAVRRYPFITAADSEGKNKFLCVDEDAQSFTKSSPDLHFFEDGKPSKMLESAMRECEQFDQDMTRSAEAIKAFQDFDLYCIKTVAFRTKDSAEESKIQFTAVDENRLKELSSDKFLALKEKGLLDLIYAHFVSLANWNRLVKRNNRA